MAAVMARTRIRLHLAIYFYFANDFLEYTEGLGYGARVTFYTLGLGHLLWVFVHLQAFLD